MQTLFRLNTSFEFNPFSNKNSENYIHKIIGSNVFGFEDFSILTINGLYLENLKGTYEHFSQFLYDIPEELYLEKFIVWEGFVYSLDDFIENDVRDTKANHTTEILFFEGTFRKIYEKELLDLLNNPQCELFT